MVGEKKLFRVGINLTRAAHNHAFLSFVSFFILELTTFTREKNACYEPCKKVCEFVCVCLWEGWGRNFSSGCVNWYPNLIILFGPNIPFFTSNIIPLLHQNFTITPNHRPLIKMIRKRKQ